MDLLKLLKTGDLQKNLEDQLKTLHYLTELIKLLNKNLEDLNTAFIQFLVKFKIEQEPVFPAINIPTKTPVKKKRVKKYEK